MRRSLHLGLAAAVLLLVAAAGAYAAWWFITAGRLEEGVGRWAQSLRVHDLDLSWHSLRVSGFPLGFRLEATDLKLDESSPAAPVALRLAALSASPASPFDFRTWRLAAPHGLSATAGPDDNPAGRLSAPAASGAILVPANGGTRLWFDLVEPRVGLGPALAARRARIWLIVPPHPPQADSDPALGFAVDAHDLTLPFAPPPFHNPLDELAFGVTLRGRLPATAKRGPAGVAAAWRDAGGSVDLDHFALRWGALSVTGSGTAALDRDLQPIGSFSGAVEGYDRLMAALVAAGRMRAGEAGLAQLALGLAKTGPDGRPQLSTSLTIQDGQMFLGPARIGPAPRIAWR